MFIGTVDQHYNRFYNAKYFRNRVLRIQKLCSELKLDAVLLVIGIDTFNDNEMKKFQNWLLYGLSGYDLHGSALNSNFEDTICIISRDSFQAYTTPQGYKELSRLSVLLPNRNIYCLTPEEFEDQELNDVKKIVKFYEMVCDKSVIGMPARQLTSNDTFKNELVMIEKWPICQSYGLDIIGGGFFTMKHHVKNIREALHLIYQEYDSFAINTVIKDEIPKNGRHFYDNFYSFLKDTPKRRLDKSEKEMIESLAFRYEFGFVGNYEEHKREDGLPVPRTLFGINTNKDHTEPCSTDKMWKTSHDRIPAHMTLESVERRASIRFARTYMLSNCSLNYMLGYHLDEDDPMLETTDDRKFNEQSANFLLHAYIALSKAFNLFATNYFAGKITKQDYHKIGYACFLKVCEAEFSLEISALKEIFNPDHFTVDIVRYNGMGKIVTVEKPSYLTLYVLRMQQRNITVNNGTDNLGSILFADSFFLTSNKCINLTKNVPIHMAFYTTPLHYQWYETTWNFMKSIGDKKVGDKLFHLDNLEGVYPVKDKYKEILSDTILKGRLIVLQGVIAFEDNTLGNFVIPYDDIIRVKFYTSGTTWAEFMIKNDPERQTNFPLNTIGDHRLYINIGKTFYSKEINLLLEIIGEDRIEKVSENFEAKSEILQTLQFKNYRVEQKKQSKDIYTGYIDCDFYQQEYDLFLEYTMVSMFNQIRDKAFVSFEQFEKLWETSQTTSKSLQDPSDKVKLILISGIPGSGKTSFGLSLAKTLNSEQIRSSCFVLPVKDSTSFSSDVFLEGLFEHYENTSTPVVIGVIPSYHHLKKAIFEFKKNSTFNEKFELEHVITRVSAKNFYRHDNKNTYQFLLENCLKGICDAIIFEKGNMPMDEVLGMQTQLAEINDEANILNVRGRVFKWDDLDQILSKKYTKYSLLYGKYFYGFEKEGKSSYYLENAVSGAYYLYKTPLRLDMLENNLHKLFNNPVSDYKELVPKEELKSGYESTVPSSGTDDKENIDDSKTKGLSESTALYFKKKEENEKKRIQADLRQEKMLLAEIEAIKKKMSDQVITVERLKGLFATEDPDDDSDYRLISNTSEVQLRSCKNSGKRLQPEELGFLVYGQNIDEKKFRNLMNAFRTQMRQKSTLRTIESITKDEIKMLEEKHFGQKLPHGFYHDGYSYINNDGKRQYEHPNLALLIEDYIDEENMRIADYNRDVEKERKADEAKFAC